MGRTAEGWRVEWKRGWALARFTWKGVDVRHALGTRDKREAQEAAARFYADVVTGRVVVAKKAPSKRLELANLLDEWLKSKSTALDPESVEMLEGYCRLFVRYFRTFDAITEATAMNFGLWRLGCALRTTVLRERAYLVQFLEWCRVQGYISSVPPVAKLPAKAQGTRVGKQRAKPVDLSPAEAKAIIKLLPMESKTIDGRKWPLRERFAFMWETALRPETISRLSVPDHWSPGQHHIELTNEDDKARFGRTVDLTPEAVRILARVAPERGVIFGRHVFYKALKKAAREILGDLRGASFAPYDFRHRRARERLDAGAKVRGVSWMLGHKRISTTDKYLMPDREVGREAIQLRASNKRPIHAPKKGRK